MGNDGDGDSSSGVSCRITTEESCKEGKAQRVGGGFLAFCEGFLFFVFVIIITSV